MTNAGNTAPMANPQDGFDQVLLIDHSPSQGRVVNPCPRCGGARFPDTQIASLLICSACAREFRRDPANRRMCQEAFAVIQEAREAERMRGRIATLDGVPVKGGAR